VYPTFLTDSQHPGGSSAKPIQAHNVLQFGQINSGIGLQESSTEIGAKWLRVNFYGHGFQISNVTVYHASGDLTKTSLSFGARRTE